MLLVIRHRRPVNSLIAIGLDYSQIADLLLKATECGYITTNDEATVLSDMGEKKLGELSGKNFETIIRPDEESRIPSQGRYDVYVPKPDKLDI